MTAQETINAIRFNHRYSLTWLHAELQKKKVDCSISKLSRIAAGKTVAVDPKLEKAVAAMLAKMEGAKK